LFKEVELKLSEKSEDNDTRVRMNKEQMEAMKMKILMYVTRSNFPVTASEIESKLPVCYPTALAMMMELALSGHLEMINRSGQRFFKAVPDKTLTVRVSQ
jgi:hypothetical protein